MQISMLPMNLKKGKSKGNLYVNLTLQTGLVVLKLMNVRNDVLTLFTHYLACWETPESRPRIHAAVTTERHEC